MAIILVALAVVVMTGLAWWWRSKGSIDLTKFLERDAPRDTVILHQFGPAPCVPSISPFVIKLETFLRIAKVPYENRFDRKRGPKGKIPWIQYNDKIISDSQHCIDFLSQKYQVDLNKRLTSQQKALGHMVRRTVEEWMYWILILSRLVFEPNATLYRTLGLPSVFVWYMKRVSISRALSQGIGLHSKEEVINMMSQDLDAIEELLGETNFLFGDKTTDVTEYDCALFGQLCQLLWQTPGSGVQEMTKESHPKLIAYCRRMKEAFWPDWNDRLLKSTEYQCIRLEGSPCQEKNKNNTSFSTSTVRNSCAQNGDAFKNLGPNLSIDKESLNNNDINDREKR